MTKDYKTIDFKTEDTAFDPLLQVTLFDELVENKDIALIRGDILSPDLKLEDANALLAMMIRDYLSTRYFYYLMQSNGAPSPSELMPHFDT